MENMFTRRQLLAAAPAFAASRSLRMATFSVDVTPPIGAPLCYSLVVPATAVETPLLAKGVVLYPSGQAPIVLCAIDWLGIGNDSHLDWRTRLAQALRTTPDRVAIHTVHQHDAPGDDRAALAFAPPGTLTPGDFCRAAVARVAAAARNAKPQRVDRLALSQAPVEKVASNRRILSPDGQTFLFQRFTACRNSPHCDAPDGVIDPNLKTLSFYSGSRRLASLHYYATHPMSYYGKGLIGHDFVGMARESLPGFHVYFTGAAGNIGAGKYNDGAPENRAVLANRIATAMKAALAAEKPIPLPALDWRAIPVILPHRTGPGFDEAAIRAVIADDKVLPRDRASHSRYLAWLLRCRQGGPNITLQSLRLDGAAILHYPGELFVEYQLAASAENRNAWTAMAAYGDYGPMYIGTAKSYAEGGYETSAVSRVAPASEEILLGAIRPLIG